MKLKKECVVAYRATGVFNCEDEDEDETRLRMV